MAQVKVILVEDVHGLGHAGELVTVKPGHARNYLLPERKAYLATDANVRELEHHKRAIAEKVARERTGLEADRDRIQALELEVAAKAGEEGKLFGSVTAAQIAELLGQKGVSVDRRKISLSDPIKELGEHEVEVRLHREVIAKVKLKVTAEE